MCRETVRGCKSAKNFDRRVARQHVTRIIDIISCHKFPIFPGTLLKGSNGGKHIPIIVQVITSINRPESTQIMVQTTMPSTLNTSPHHNLAPIECQRARRHGRRFRTQGRLQFRRLSNFDCSRSISCPLVRCTYMVCVLS